MRKLHFVYEMGISYSIEVGRCNYTIKCIPKDSIRQKIFDETITISPATRYLYGMDGLRNLQIYGVNELPHKEFTYRIEGNAVTGLCDFEENVDDNLAMIFRHPHGLNVAGQGIIAYYNEIKPDRALSDYEKALHIMHRLNKDFEYKPCSTDVNTTAEEAFVLGTGVCQDYAHIFISLLHLARIPARYVTGLILGEGASHAWVEVLVDGKWYGLDPTNNSKVYDDHIKIGVGRDARDCTINRGIMHGGGLHTQTIKVNVTERE